MIFLLLGFGEFRVDFGFAHSENGMKSMEILVDEVME